jgi:uncharacterized protein, PH0010 family
MREIVGNTLIAIAHDAILAGLGEPLRGADEQQRWLHEKGATFVTLNRRQQLRGCMGSLQAHRVLLADIKANAAAAAFRDPRFPPLEIGELDEIEIEVSLLSALEPVIYENEQHALRQLRPGIDGVLLEFGAQRGTFLPQVWGHFSDTASFLRQLKQKAGLPADFWHDDIRLQRYSVEKFKQSDLPLTAAAEGMR